MDHLVELFHHVHGDADRAALVGDRAGHRLADPPGGVGRELVAAAVVELLHRADQPQRALLDQVEEREAAAHVALGDRHHQAQVGLDHVLLGGHVAALDALAPSATSSLGAEQRHAADRAQVQAQRVEARLDARSSSARRSASERVLVACAAVLTSRPRRPRASAVGARRSEAPPSASGVAVLAGSAARAAPSPARPRQISIPCSSR